DEAEAMIRARIARLRAQAEDSRALAGALSDLGDLMNQRGRPRDAELAYRESFERAARFVGRRHPHVIAPLAGWSTALGMQGRRAESEALLVEAIGIVENTRPVDERLLATLYINLATTMAASRPEAALGHAREALRLAEAAKASA